MTRLVVATSFGIHPPRGGGQVRVAGLYGALARLGVEVRIVALVAAGERAGVRKLAPAVIEQRVPKSAPHEAAEREMTMRAGIPITDIALARCWHLTPAYGDALAAAADGAAAVVASHPFAQPAIAERASAPLVYEAHNVELDLKRNMLAGSDAADELLGAVREVEAACCATAAHVIVCAGDDGSRLGELYGLETDRVVVVPNGIDPKAFGLVPPEARASRRVALRMGDRPHALFLGSWHEPNLVAVRDVLRAAEALSHHRFLIVGSAGLAFASEPVPGNVDLCGVVADGFVRELLGVAHVALNPMRFGSGTNLKMLSYALAGTPIVSSEFGARGLEMRPDEHYIAADPDALADALRAFAAEPAETTTARVEAASRLASERFAWDAIARRWLTSPALTHLFEREPVA